MRRLMLLRHAKSDWSVPGLPDHERALAPRGRDAAPRMGGYMEAHALVPDHAIVSTARRTRETWQLVAGAFSRKPHAAFDRKIYEASPSAILASIAAAPASAMSLLIIGHNPGLQETAMHLAKPADTPAYRAMSEKFPTAALAVFDVDLPDWQDIKRARGRLERFITPRAIGKMQD